MIYKLTKFNLSIYFYDLVNLYKDNGLDLKHMDSIEEVSSIPKGYGQLIVKPASYNKCTITWDSTSETAIVSIARCDDSVKNVTEILLNNLMLREFEKNGMYMIHASAVALYDNCYLFFGGSGSGKTVQMLNILRSLPQKAKYISNGSVLLKHEVEKIRIIGTYKKSIKLRGSTLYQYNRVFFKQIFSKNENIDNTFYAKKELMPESLGFTICKDTEVLNAKFYFLKVNKADFIYYPKTTNYKYLMQIFQDVSRHLKMSELYCVMNDQALYIPSFDSKSLFVKRIAFINQFASIIAGRLYGELDEITDFIINDGEKEQKI